MKNYNTKWLGYTFWNYSQTRL